MPKADEGSNLAKPSVLRLIQRRDRVERVDEGRPLADVPLAAHAELHVVFRDVHPARFFEDDDVPALVAIVVRLVAIAEGDVLGDEVPEVTVDVLPGRKMRQASARGAGVLELLAGVLGIEERDREVVDDRVVANRCSPSGSSALPS